MDKYDKQIEELTRSPQNIIQAWGGGVGLFAYVTDGKNNVMRIGVETESGQRFPGCITQIRGGSRIVAIFNGEVNEELTQEIKGDERLPSTASDIMLHHLPLFAYYQRKADALKTL